MIGTEQDDAAEAEGALVSQPESPPDDAKLESLSRLAGGLAHDFNNFLTGILGNTQLILRKLDADSECRLLVQEIERSARHAGELTQEILNYAGRGQLSAKPLDLTELVRSMTRLLETSAPSNAQLMWRLDDDLPELFGDAASLRQLVLQLTLNAGHALDDDGGYVSLATGAQEVTPRILDELCPGHTLTPGAHVFFEVSDTGCGMDDAARRKIFDPFFSTKPGGRGMGLSTVFGTVRCHGGGIRLRTSAGSGTTFRVYFPVADTATVGDEAAAPQSTVVGTSGTQVAQGMILVVDDEHFVRTVAEGILKDEGFRTLGAADGLEALDLYGRYGHQIALVLLDLTMPGLNGLETLRRLRELAPGVEVIVTSGYNTLGDGESVGDGRPVSFLRKPYRPQQLVDAVREILES